MELPHLPAPALPTSPKDMTSNDCQLSANSVSPSPKMLSWIDGKKIAVP